MVIPYPSARPTMRFFTSPGIFIVIVAVCKFVGFAGRPFMLRSLLKQVVNQCRFWYYLFLDNYYPKGVT
jgi:hypothetical protein